MEDLNTRRAGMHTCRYICSTIFHMQILSWLLLKFSLKKWVIVSCMKVQFLAFAKQKKTKNNLCKEKSINDSHIVTKSNDGAVCTLRSSSNDVCWIHWGHRSCPVLKINPKPAGIISTRGGEWKRRQWQCWFWSFHIYLCFYVIMCSTFLFSSSFYLFCYFF